MLSLDNAVGYTGRCGSEHESFVELYRDVNSEIPYHRVFRNGYYGSDARDDLSFELHLSCDFDSDIFMEIKNTKTGAVAYNAVYFDGPNAVVLQPTRNEEGIYAMCVAKVCSRSQYVWSMISMNDVEVTLYD